MKAATRRTWLALSVVALLALIWFAPDEDSDIASPALDKTKRSRQLVTERNKPVHAAQSQATRTGIQPLQRSTQAPAALAEAVPDLFAAVSWYVEPPPPSPAPPPPPSAPALPFVYLGQYIEGNQQTIMLMRGTRMLGVRVGEVIDKNYQIVSMQDGQLTFLYLPLNVAQSLATGTPQ